MNRKTVVEQARTNMEGHKDVISTDSGINTDGMTVESVESMSERRVRPQGSALPIRKLLSGDFQRLQRGNRTNWLTMVAMRVQVLKRNAAATSVMTYSLEFCHFFLGLAMYILSWGTKRKVYCGELH